MWLFFPFAMTTTTARKAKNKKKITENDTACNKHDPDKIRFVAQHKFANIYTHAEAQWNARVHQTGKIFLMENVLTSWFNQIKCTSHNLAKGGQCEVTPTHTVKMREREKNSLHRTQQSCDLFWTGARQRTRVNAMREKLRQVNGCALKPD